ncbi:MAG: hypothetical protein WKF37_14370, partial [Bryobacteraceae bacterium]
MNKSGCEQKEPFIKLGDGTAPGLNYNLPQKSEFSVYSRIASGTPKEWFKDETFAVPAGNWWIKSASLPELEIERDV